MSITIEIYERTGPAGSPTDQLVTNVNWKSQSLPDNLYKYFYYPIRLPEDGNLMSCSVPKYLYAKISGTYSAAKRVRWSITGTKDVGTLIMLGQTSTYSTPTPSMSGLLTNAKDSGNYVFPKLSTTTTPNPSAAFTPTLAANTTYCTDFLVTQFIALNSYGTVGNSNEILVRLELDEYE